VAQVSLKKHFKEIHNFSDTQTKRAELSTWYACQKKTNLIRDIEGKWSDETLNNLAGLHPELLEILAGFRYKTNGEHDKRFLDEIEFLLF